ncbi:MAG: hypothetical protein ACI9DC_000226 [Gammaproteobacteria bacterium]
MRHNGSICVFILLALSVVGLSVLLLGSGVRASAQQPPLGALPQALFDVLKVIPEEAGGLLDTVDANWDPRIIPMILDTTYLSRSALVSLRMLRLLDKHTGQSIGVDLQQWYQWMWQQDIPMHPEYPAFKSRLYGLVDPKFKGYFSPERTMKVRLDEVVWGGVRQDGIPPLRNPDMIPAEEATYLADDNVIFGLAVNGDARAYPKRILAWHEMFTDTIGGMRVAGVYCTLCGAMIVYESTLDGVKHELGTSGFLYRSNKLMYDKGTQSLWSTLGGEPVIGPLAGKGIRLKRGSVVTTTWGEWRKRHPQTQVLSLNTGHQRDYSEGKAYQDYFATDELMFQVPQRDGRLANKAEIVGLVFAQAADKPLAIAADYLKSRPVHHNSVNDLKFVVLTDPSGANRVYQSDAVTFTAFDGQHIATDSEGNQWTLTEDMLAGDGKQLARLPAHRAFWFGWYAAYPHTRLVN